jgi:hypothetical protein
VIVLFEEHAGVHVIAKHLRGVDCAHCFLQDAEIEICRKFKCDTGEREDETAVNFQPMEAMPLTEEEVP